MSSCHMLGHMYFNHISGNDPKEMKKKVLSANFLVSAYCLGM